MKWRTGTIVSMSIDVDMSLTDNMSWPVGLYLCDVFREENLAKIARRVKDYKVEEMNPPREGKRLLVLDVDYTLFGELQ